MANEVLANLRAKYPGAYDHLDDITLAQKLVAKYPMYADKVPVSPPNDPEVLAIQEHNAIQQGKTQGPIAPPPAGVIPDAFQPADVAAGGAMGAPAGLATAARVGAEMGAMAPLQALAQPLTNRVPESVDPMGAISPVMSAPIPARWLAEQAVGLLPGVAGEMAAGRVAKAPARVAEPVAEPVKEPVAPPAVKVEAPAPAPVKPPAESPPPRSTDPPLGSKLTVGGRDMTVVGHDATHVSVETANSTGRTTMRLPKSFFNQRGAVGNLGSQEEAAQMAGRIAGPTELPPRAGNINLANINSPDDVKRALTEVADANEGFIHERRGVIPLDEQERLASELGFRPKDLLKRKTGEAFNAEKAIAARQLLAQSAGDLVGLAKKAVGGSEYDLVAFQRGLTQHTAIQEEVAGMTAEAGRALGAFRVAVGSGGDTGTAAQTAAIRSVLTHSGGRERVETIASHIAGLDDPGRINRYVRQARNKPTGKLFWLYLNSLLSNPVTWSVKTLSDAASNLTNIADTAAASLIGKVHGGEKVYAREAASDIVSLASGVQDAFKAAWHTMRTGEQVMGGGMVEARPIEGTLGNIIGAPVRVLKTIDEFWKTVSFRQAMHASAYREGLQQGLRGPALRQFVDEYLTHPPDKAVTAAENTAHYLTQTRTLGAHARAVSRVVEETPGMKYLIPFRRVPINLIKFAVEHSTAAPMLSDVRKMLQAGGAQRDLALGRMATGSAVGLWAVQHALNGNITGGGPVNPRERATWLLGHQPYSIRIGDKWVSYQRIEPLAFILGTAADYADASKQTGVKDSDLAKVAGRIVLSITRDLASKTYLRTLTELAQVMSDPNGRYAQRFAATLLSSPIPAGLAQIARVQDPFQRETKSILDAMRIKVPGLRQGLPIRRDVMGKPETQEGAVGPALMSPFYTHGIVNDPVVGELNRLEIGLGKPHSNVYDNLTPEAMAEFVERRGKIATQYIESLIKAPWYQKLNDKQQRKLIGRQFTNASKAARAQMVPQFAAAFKAGAMKRDPEPKLAPNPVP